MVSGAEPTNDLDGLGRASLLLTPIPGGNTYEQTVERLLQTVRMGLVKPGERLPSERELAVMLDVSRDTIRDATASLADAGFLDIRRGRYGGTFVSPTLTDVSGQDSAWRGQPSPMGPEDIKDLLVFRAVLEVGAARTAATLELTSDIRDALWRAHVDSSTASPENFRRLDSRFHLLIAQITGSRRLIGEVASTRMRVNELLDEIPLLSPNIEHSTAQHEEIVSAILRGQPELAEMAMRDHLEGTAALLRGFLG
ncbi:MAG: FCD domain-containing protein [Pontimonas sp.]|nr:FCD domain-containing protein [Pontimonas sp.]